MIAMLLAAAALVAVQPLPGESRGPDQRSGPGPRLSPGEVAGTEPRTAVEAEAAFAADAQRIGQWAAFRKWAAADATMFVPEPTDAQTWLKGRPEPKRAVAWRVAKSFVSCDGSMAVNTGPARWPDGRLGYFTTVWLRQPGGGWRWELDHGDIVPVAKFAWDAPPVVRRAACAKVTAVLPPIAQPPGGRAGWAQSNDMSLSWVVQVHADGARRLNVMLWDGQHGITVVRDEVAAPKP